MKADYRVADLVDMKAVPTAVCWASSTAAKMAAMKGVSLVLCLAECSAGTRVAWMVVTEAVSLVAHLVEKWAARWAGDSVFG